MDLTNLADVSTTVAFIGIMAFLVSAVTEVLKKISWLEKHVPTALTVIIISVVLCPVTLIAVMNYMSQPITWYMVFASFIAAFIVALIAMDGWETVKGLADRTLSKKGK